MTELMTATPIVMSVTDHDPCGGAGVSAAIETITSLGCHCTPVITKLTARDTSGQKDYQLTETHLFIEQIRAVFEDMPINVMTVGDLASVGNVEALYTILKDYTRIPVVLNYSSAATLGNSDLGKAIADLILPLAEVTIVNQRHLPSMTTGADTVAACAQELIETGCKNLLITGSRETSVCNHWYSQHGQCQTFEWERLYQEFQGAADTLTAALGSYLAHGISLATSIQQAQIFTRKTLEHSRRIGMGKWLPNRMHWTES